MSALLKFWGRGANSAEVKPGNRFCRRRGNITETATVLQLRDDPLGIPHVQFELEIEKPAYGRFEGGLRVLALSSFIDAYRERLA